MNIMIRHANPDDHKSLFRLWHESFGDDVNFIRFYFERRHRDDQMLIYEHNGQIAGMLSLLPTTLSMGDDSHPARYVYAVATAKRFRGKGIATALLNAAHDFIHAHQEYAAILSPSSASLFAFYEKLGYETIFSVNEKTVTSKDILSPSTEMPMRTPSADDIFRIRNCFFADNVPFVQWREDAIHYVIDLFQTHEKGALLFKNDTAEAYAICGKRDHAIYIYEMAHLGMSEAKALSIIHHHFGASSYILRTPEDSTNTATARCFGMIRYNQSPKHAMIKKNPYLGLALD